jgi:hypothetical protein
MLLINMPYQISSFINKTPVQPARQPFTIYKKNAWFLKKQRNIAPETVARLS